MRRLVLVLAAVALVAAACSDGGGDTAATTTTTTSAETTTTTTNAPSTTAASTTTEPVGVTFTGADGVTTTITDTSRIVSLNGDLTEVIAALGLVGNIVAVDVTTVYPPETDALPRVGFGQQLAPEGVIAFQPTVVIGDQQVGPSETIDQLRATGIPVAILAVQTTLDGVSTKILEVAEILGVSDRGQELVDSVEAEIDAARELASGAETQPRVAFLYVRGPQQVFLFGAGTVTNAMIEGAGAIDAIAESGIAGLVPLTPEALVAAAPDVIIAPAAGVQAIGGEAGLAQLPGVAETPAGAAGSFLVYDDAFFLNFGPRTGQALDQLVRDLYPDLTE